MDTVTYPDARVAAYIEAHFIAHKPYLNNRQDQPLFRANRIIWTPTAAFMDRNGAMHYHAPGWLPAAEFLSVLKIGRARCLMAWTRAGEAAAELESAAGEGDALAPEALYWLGVARFLERRDSSRMWDAWDRLKVQYPLSPWAARVYPKGEGGATP